MGWEAGGDPDESCGRTPGGLCHGRGSIALIIGAVVLTYVDRHASLPAGSGTWGFSYVFNEVVNAGQPAATSRA